MSIDFDAVTKARTSELELKMNPITLDDPKHELFAKSYLATGNKTQSCKNAGITFKTADKLMMSSQFKLFLKYEVEMLKKDTIAEPEEVLEFLTSTMRGEVFEPTKVGVGRGEEKIDYLPPKVSDRIKAGELLGKRYAVFDDSINVAVKAVPTFVGLDEVKE